MATPSNAYLTPMAENLSASLRAGTYDARANLLRTCSLPDLTSLVVAPLEPEPEPVGVASSAWKPEAGEGVVTKSGDCQEGKVSTHSVRQGEGEEEGSSEEEDNVFSDQVCEGEGVSMSGEDRMMCSDQVCEGERVSMSGEDSVMCSDQVCEGERVSMSGGG